jgi:hypothetical protein
MRQNLAWIGDCLIKAGRPEWASNLRGAGLISVMAVWQNMEVRRILRDGPGDADTKQMLKYALLPLIVGALLASAFAPAPAPQPTAQTSHSERIALDRSTPAAPRVSALESGLPLTWCGTKSTTDQTVNATDDGAPKFKFYYVNAADQPDRFSEVADLLQKSISAAHSYLLNVTGATRTIAIDTGTSCGSLYVDITALTLPNNLASYQTAGQPDWTTLMDDLETLTGAITGPPRHHVYLLDQFEDATHMSGRGYRFGDDGPGESNLNNSDGLIAAAATSSGAIDEWVSASLPALLLHEMTHTMGAVQESAPHSTSAGHCTDGFDVMCYDDGSPEGSGYSADVCTVDGISGIGAPYDCNKDDYFNPAPAPASYLDTHWNVYNSKYLVHCTSGDPYCTSLIPTTPLPKIPPIGPPPPARSAINDLNLYKKGKRGKKVGSVKATGAKEPLKAFVRNTVSVSKLKLPKGKWKTTLCLRQTGTKAVCSSKTRKTSKSGKLTVPSIYITTPTAAASVWGTLSIKPVSKSLKKKRYEVRTTKSPQSYSLEF